MDARDIIGRRTGRVSWSAGLPVPRLRRRDRLIAVIDRVGGPPTFHVKHGD
ncbi:hypothetical protein [Antrihabitans spumae]|uniref:Uncharacterized protein n=1 Tax=Antrihabitans spumae TaxID=3373370 RepID=A0ABW7JWP7_9NOCA